MFLTSFSLPYQSFFLSFSTYKQPLVCMFQVKHTNGEIYTTLTYQVFFFTMLLQHKLYSYSIVLTGKSTICENVGMPSTNCFDSQHEACCPSIRISRDGASCGVQLHLGIPSTIFCHPEGPLDMPDKVQVQYDNCELYAVRPEGNPDWYPKGDGDPRSKS